MTRLRGGALFAAANVDLDHRALDDIGRRSLHGRVDRGPLGRLAPLSVAGVDVRQVKPASEQRFHVALVTRLLAGLLHELLHARVAHEIGIHVGLGFAPARY